MPRRISQTGKREDLLAILRQRIATGEWAPGMRVPTRELLVAEFNVASATIQSVFDTMQDDGMIETFGRRGTFVSKKSPHLCSYGIVFQSTPMTNPRDGTFSSAIAYEALTMPQHGIRQCNCYYNLSGHTDEPDYQRLLQDVAAHRLAGVIFEHGGVARWLEPTITEINPLPMVCLQGDITLEMPFFEINRMYFYQRAFTHFSDRERRRVAVIGLPTFDSDNAIVYADALASSGLQSKPYWQIPFAADVQLLLTVRNLVNLLMRAEGEKPDALLITDDIFVDQVLVGLQDVGVRIGEDIDVIAHGNYPLLKADQLPIIRLGYPIRLVFDTAIALIDAQRQGNPAPIRVCIPPLLQSEYSPGVSILPPTFVTSS